MLRKIFICVLFVLMTIGYGQVLRDAINNNSSDASSRLVPKVMNYQGYLTDIMGIPIDDDLNMKFRIYASETGGSVLWAEDTLNVSVERGVFNALLGSMNQIPDSVFTTGTDRWLELILNVSDTLSPRTVITAMGYAYMATHADTAEYAKNAVADNDWVRGGTGDTILFTANYLGIARGGVSNVLYGDYIYSHLNFGVVCTTGHSVLNERYCTVGGGYGNAAAREYTTVSGGYSNRAFYDGATVAGGYNNTASGEYSAIGGGYGNAANNDYGVVAGGWGNVAGRSYSAIGGGVGNQTDGSHSVISGGYQNYNEGHYSAISGGYADTIADGADYSYLFGIASKMTEDSTFMVDMPHIWFGDETNGYEFPLVDGSIDQIMVTDGSGQLSWNDGVTFSNWSVIDSVLYTDNLWGLARGGADNILYGDSGYTHTNFGGHACTTGISGEHNTYITVCGGYGNRADSNYSTVAGGFQNKAVGRYSFIGSGQQNNANGLRAGVICGSNNTAGGSHSFVGSGYNNTAGDIYAVVGGGSNNTASANNSVIGGGKENFIEGDYSAIIGGCGDTITADADYSYLFGVGSKLTQDSTFMVDMPYIRFGDETDGYEFPVTDGTADQVMITDGSGQLNWIDVPSDTDWVISANDMYSNIPGNVGIGTTTPDYKLDVAGSAGFNDTIYHNDDDDTYFYFSNDQIDLYAGNVQMITADETTQDILVINENSNDVDFRVESDNDENALFVQGNNGNVGLGIASPLEKLDVDGTVQVTGFKMPTGALSGHILTSDALGSGTWQVVPDDNDWIRSTPDSVLFTAHALGIARGGVGNIMYGTQVCRHTNLGAYQCTTGVSGQNYSYITICGGNGNRADSAYSVVVSGNDNKARGRYSFVGGGISNIAGSYHSFIGSGIYNETSGDYAIVVGGYSNAASGYRSFIGGGYSNETNNQYTSICGGRDNTADGDYSIIGGGYSNATFDAPYMAILSGYSHEAGDAIDDTAAVVVGGYNNSALEKFAFVGGGRDNSADGKFATICGGYSHEANGYASGVLSGYNNSASSNADTATVIAGGWGNTADRFAFIGGGKNNTAWNYSTVSGGEDNTAIWSYSTISGGSNNEATRDYTTVGGGRDNNAYHDYTTVCGGRENRAHYDYATVCGGYQDTVHAYYGGILSGYRNLAGDEYEDTAAVVVCGKYNSAEAKYAFIGCGQSDTVRAIYGVVVSGYSNMGGDAWTGQDTAAVVVGGWNNAATGKFAFIGGGKNNTAGNYGTVSGGRSNRAEDAYATVAGGYADTSSGMYSFTTNYNSVVPIGCQHSAAFTGQTATAISQVRAWQFSSAMGGGFSIDHPLDPTSKILSHRFVESPEMVLIYRGIVHIEADGRVEVHLPDYFDVLNKNPMVQLTGVGTSDVFVAQEVDGNRFVVGGKPNTKVYWTVTGERKDQSAEIGQILVPVEQIKKGYLAGHSLDDDGLAVVKMDLEQLGKAGEFHFKTQAGREKYSNLKQKTQELNSGVIKQ